MKKNIKRLSLLVIIILIAAAAAWGPIVSNVEQAKYEVVSKSDDVEIRDYAPMIVAEVEVEGERKIAISKGFRLIADYIFGNNVGAKPVAMTAPVIQEQGEKVAMTAPVLQEGEGTKWKVRFVMPSSYTLATLPTPNNKVVQLKEIEGKRFAVIRFSGWGNDENLQKHELKLQEFLKAEKLQALGTARYAFFNPPWTLPFLRRNEVMVEINK